MMKGKCPWAALLVLVVSACATTETDTSAEQAAGPARYEGSVLVDRLRALEGEVATVAAEKVWAAPLTGASLAKRCWLDGKMLIIEAWNPATREFEIFMVDAEKGKNRWMLVLGPNGLAYPPHIGHGTITFMTAEDGAMVVVDSARGSRLYHNRAKVSVLTSHDVTSSRDTVFLGSTLSQKLVALNAQDGRRGWDIDLDGLASTSPVLAHQLATPLVMVGTSTGQVAAVQAQEWNEVAPAGTTWARDFAAPITAELNFAMIGGTAEGETAKPMLLVPCEDNNFYGLDATNGRSNWVLRTNAPFRDYAAAYNGKIFVRNVERMFCLDARTGRRLWMNASSNSSEYEKSQLFGPPAGFELADRFLCESGDKVYFLEGTNTIWRCLAADGSVDGSGNLPSFDFFMTNQATGTLIVGTSDGMFVAFK